MSKPNNDPNKKLHWFLLTFMVPGPGRMVPASVYGSYTKKILPIPAAHAIRDLNELPESAILTGISYLGFESTHYMRGTSDKPVASKVGDVYMQGLVASRMAAEQPGLVIENPYTYLVGRQEGAEYLHQEWNSGYEMGMAVTGRVSQAVNPASASSPDPTQV